jgi:hypothetical protein
MGSFRVRLAVVEEEDMFVGRRNGMLLCCVQASQCVWQQKHNLAANRQPFTFYLTIDDTDAAVAQAPGQVAAPDNQQFPLHVAVVGAPSNPSSTALCC